MSNIQLRRGIEPDRQVLYALLASYLMEAEVDPAEFIIATSDGRLVGTARLEREEGAAYIRPLVVDSQWQSKGIGRLLMQALIKESPSLNVVARGQVAKFYQRLGFIPVPWEQVPSRYQSECQDCPDQNSCHPTSMTLSR